MSTLAPPSSVASRVPLGLTTLVLLALCSVQIGHSLGWPLIGDAALLHYISWCMEEGAVPYRDTFDMNFPGTLALHWVARALFGPSDAGWRSFDLAATAAIAWLVYSIGRPTGRWTALTAAAAFSSFHVAGGPARLGQRDFLVVLPLLGAVRAAMWLRAHPSSPTLPAALAGFALGAAATVKPVCGAFLAVIAVWMVWVLERRQHTVRALLSLMVASLLAPLAALFWLWRVGGLSSFFDLLWSYLLPLYRALGPSPALRWRLLAVTVIVASGLGTLTWWARRTPRALTPERALLLAGVGYGLFHFAYQGKGWVYHLYPLIGLICGLAATVGDNLFLPGRGRLWTRTAWSLFVAATLVYATVRGFSTGSMVWRGFDPNPNIARRVDRVDSMAADLEPLLAAGDTVQVFDTARGGLHALLRLEVHQPTRFIYDFHFYHDVENPTIQALRSELMAGLRSAPPRALVLLEHMIGSKEGYERMERFPELRDWVAQQYRLAASGDQYRIYRRRVDLPGPSGSAQGIDVRREEGAT